MASRALASLLITERGVCGNRVGNRAAAEATRATSLRFSLGERAKKIPTDKGWDFEYWWRRRESNPRPQVLYSQFYILSLVIWFNRGHANRQAGTRRFTLTLTLSRVKPAQHELMYMTLHLACASQPMSRLGQGPAGFKRLERNARRLRL